MQEMISLMPMVLYCVPNVQLAFDLSIKAAHFGLWIGDVYPTEFAQKIILG